MSAAMDIVERLRFDSVRCEMQFSKGVAGNIEEAASEIEQLRALLKEIDATWPVATSELRERVRKVIAAADANGQPSKET